MRGAASRAGAWVIGGLVTGLALASGSGVGARPGTVGVGERRPAPGPTRGATPLDAQARALDGMLPVGRAGPDGILPPPVGVDRTLWALSVPADNAPTPARIALGRRLYFDTRLSADGSVACATCHDVSRGFADARATSEGIGGATGRRNAPTTLNVVFYETLFADGRAASLEAQAGFSPQNPIEGGHADREAVMRAIGGDPAYPALFRSAYGRPPNFEDLTRAIAAFERTLVFLRAPFDRFLSGEWEVLTPAARRGWALFNGKARCVTCHPFSATSPIGTDNAFHNIGVAAHDRDFEALARAALTALEAGGGPEAVDRLALTTDLSELGRFLVTKSRSDIGAFKTQGVRNVGVTAPYMHDGSMRTLWDVVDHYNKGGEQNAFLDGGMLPLALSEDEIDALVEFMFALTDERLSARNEAEMKAQRAIAAESRPFRDTERAMGLTRGREAGEGDHAAGRGRGREGGEAAEAAGRRGARPPAPAGLGPNPPETQE